MTSTESDKPEQADRTIIRLLAALLVKGDTSQAAAVRLLGIGLDSTEVGAILGITPGAVRAFKVRAKRAGRKRRGPSPTND